MTTSEKVNFTNGAAKHAHEPDGPDLWEGVEASAEPSTEPEKSATSSILDGPKIAAPMPDLVYLVPALGIPLGGGAPHIVGGYGFGGKSIAMQDACLSTAAGRAWFGAFSCASGPAFYFDGEQGERLSRLRFQRLARDRNIDLADLTDLRLWSFPPFRLTDLNVETVLSKLLVGARMAVFDSLRAFCPGVDENDSRAREPLDMLGRVSARTGCACFVIHHARKAREGDDTTGKYMLRGSSGIFDACDVVFCLGAEKNEPTYVSQTKAREHGELAEDFCFEVEDVANHNNPRWGLKVKVLGKEAIQDARNERESTRRDAVIERMRSKIIECIRRTSAAGTPVTSIEDMAAAIVARQADVRIALTALQASGELSRSKARGPWTIVGVSDEVSL